MDLPNELVLLICTHIENPLDTQALSSTCHSLREVIFHGHLNRLYKSVRTVNIDHEFPTLPIYDSLCEPLITISEQPYKGTALRTDHSAPRLAATTQEIVGNANLLGWVLQNPMLGKFVSSLRMDDLFTAQELEPAFGPQEEFETNFDEEIPYRPFCEPDDPFNIGISNSTDVLWVPEYDYALAHLYKAQTPDDLVWKALDQYEQWRTKDTIQYRNIVQTVNNAVLRKFGVPTFHTAVTNPNVQCSWTDKKSHQVMIDPYLPPIDNKVRTVLNNYLIDSGDPSACHEQGTRYASGISSFYASFLLHKDIFPNLTRLFLSIGNSDDGYTISPEVVQMLKDHRNLPKLQTCIITPNNRVDGSITFDPVCALMNRPTMRTLAIHMLLEWVWVKNPEPFPVFRMPESNIEHLILQAPRPRACVSWDTTKQKTRWFPYTSLMEYITAPHTLRTLVVREPPRLMGERRIQVGEFAEDMANLVTRFHKTTLTKMKIEGKVLHTLDGTPRIRVVKETCPDGITRKFYDLGARMQNLNVLTNVKVLGIQLWHILGRNYHQKHEITLLDNGFEGRPAKCVTSRAAIFPQYLPPNIEEFTIYAGVNKKSRTAHFDAEKIAANYVMKAIFAQRKTLLKSLVKIIAPQVLNTLPARTELFGWNTKAASEELVSWVKMGEGVGVVVELWNENDMSLEYDMGCEDGIQGAPEVVHPEARDTSNDPGWNNEEDEG